MNETEGFQGFYHLETASSVKYGQFIKPDTRFKIFVRFLKKEGRSSHFEGRIDVLKEDKPAGRAILADFYLVPVS